MSQIGRYGAVTASLATSASGFVSQVATLWSLLFKSLPLGVQESQWGANYPRLLEIKQKVDPAGLFVCHHCVGSEGWSVDGFCKI